jgi:CDP-diacylglycerol---glycerol-3-phosphate 3-phosphatidyltransferase
MAAAWRYTPNVLTLSRIGLAAAFFTVLTPWRYVESPLVARPPSFDWWLALATLLFILAAVTDALDGHLARRWKVVTAFGRVMDPFADKLLIIGAFVYLAGPGFMMQLAPPNATVKQLVRALTIPVTGVTPWMVVVILGRELLVTSIRAVIEGRGGSFAATTSGKLKMILQSICVPLVLVLVNVPQPAGPMEGWTRPWILIIVWTTIAITAWSAVPYIVRAVRALRTEERA